MNRHHIKPRSRIHRDHDEDTNNIVILNEGWHDAWHRCFANLTVAETHEMIDIMMQPGKSWNHRQIRSLRRFLMRKTRQGGEDA